MSILTKMSVSTMGCKPKVASTEEREIALARIAGRASGIKTTEGRGGDATYALTGAFRGKNLQNGLEFQAAVLYLPGGIQELILGPLDDALAGSEDGTRKADPNASVDFAFDIIAFPAANPIGYSYRAIDLVPAARVDPLADLMAQVGQRPLPQLAAPK